eukprot:759141-Hanusia_phi.AAC.5
MPALQGVGFDGDGVVDAFGRGGNLPSLCVPVLPAGDRPHPPAVPRVSKRQLPRDRAEPDCESRRQDDEVWRLLDEFCRLLTMRQPIRSSHARGRLPRRYPARLQLLLPPAAPQGPVAVSRCCLPVPADPFAPPPSLASLAVAGACAACGGGVRGCGEVGEQDARSGGGGRRGHASAADADVCGERNAALLSLPGATGGEGAAGPEEPGLAAVAGVLQEDGRAGADVSRPGDHRSEAVKEEEGEGQGEEEEEGKELGEGGY